MRILLLFPMADGQTGPAIKHAFENLGHEVYAVDAKLKSHESFLTSYWVEPDLVFCSRTKELTNQVAQIKKTFPEAITCMWNVDQRGDISHWKNLYPLIRLVDFYFVIETYSIPEWKKLNPNTFWLPQGLQDEIYDRPKEITNADRKKYTCDVSFTGRIYGYRKAFLEAVRQMDISFKIWGANRRWRVINEDHNKMAVCSTINLGMSACPEKLDGVSVRDYKIMGAGGFLLERYREDIENVFPTNTMACYTDSEDLVEAIKFWLDPAQAQSRRQRAERGYKWVHSHATYIHRMRTALETMGL